MSHPSLGLSAVHLSDLFDELPQAVIVANVARQITYFNAAAEGLFGYDAEHAIGRTTEFLYARSEDFADQGERRFNSRVNPRASSRRVSYQRKDGTVFLGETLGGAMRDADGIVSGFVGIVQVASVMGRAVDALQRLHVITANSELSFPERMQAILELGAEHFGLPLAIQSRIQGDEYLVEHCVDPAGQLEPGAIFSVAGTYCTHTLARGMPTGFHHAGQSEIRNHPCYTGFGLESYLGCQIRVDGAVYGTLNFSRSESCHPFTHDDLGFIELLADWMGHAIAAERTRRELETLAQTDGLTGLLNRRTLRERMSWQLAHAERSGLPLSVVMCDIDHFKRVNDTWGHDAGDAVLREFAARAGGMSREVDLSGRFGGEEFIFVLPDTDADGARVFAQRLLDTLSLEPVPLPNGELVTVTASFGVATAELNGTVDDLVSRADAAMYEAKDRGRAQVRLAS